MNNNDFKGKMNTSLGLLSSIITIMSFLISVTISVTTKIYSLAICLLIVSLIGINYLVHKQIKTTQYVRFVEYLMNNDIHNFVLLPRLRMYLESKKICNKIKINQLDITYNVTCCDTQTLMGDLEINYKLYIENRNIPGEIEFISGNDFSSERQTMKYKYGMIDDFKDGSAKQHPVAPYWKGLIKHYSIKLEEQYIPKQGAFELDMQVCCAKTFDFKIVDRDTIICLPKIFSEDIEKITYYIIIQGYEDRKFYCNAYIIYEKNGKFTRADIPCTDMGNAKFKIDLFPNSYKGEKAYYFRVGLSEEDREQFI